MPGESESQIQTNKERPSVEHMGGRVSIDKKDSKFQDGCDSNCYLCHSQNTASKSATKRRRRYENDTIGLVAEKEIPFKKLRVTELYANPSGRNSLMAAFFRLLGMFLVYVREVIFTKLAFSYLPKCSC